MLKCEVLELGGRQDQAAETAQQGPSSQAPPAGPRPPLPKLRVKLGGVRLSGTSSQPTASSHSVDPKAPGETHPIQRRHVTCVMDRLTVVIWLCK